ncbi:MAG TPA: DUF5682 family protein [Saprospiraceae bacterium]|nr:DUF5682 family protein [Saprospiraceae bacterium]
MVRVFGIRHHGPGSARHLLQALEQWQPDCLLLESPADAQSVIRHAADADLQPPVAILLYNPKNLTQASWLPFATFSPEWQALQYGLQQHIPTQLIDLPMSLAFVVQNQPAQRISLQWDDQELFPAHDPIAYIAQLAGFTDSERWWEVIFEHTQHQTDVFEAIIEMMSALRETLQRQESYLTLLRESYMRQGIRKAVDKGYERIAVVCGAWHAPVLHGWQHFKKSADNQLLKGISKLPTEATWTPWSYERLAFQSGYRAGVLSPAWYELLFQHRSEAPVVWMTKAAQLLRAARFEASTANVLEAVHLSETLASLRNLPLPGVEEMREAALAALCNGDQEPLQWIENELIVGNVIGHVPNRMAAALQQDLERCIKAVRLTKAYQSATSVVKQLDLRKEIQLEASILLHRLRLLDVPWGTLQPASLWQKGSFRESWTLHWQPAFGLALIEAGMWGNTVYEAAAHRVQQKALLATELPDIAGLIQEAMQAALPEAMNPLLQRLQDMIVHAPDILRLMQVLEPLVQMMRYSDLRQTDTMLLEKLAHELVPRICIGLPAACSGVGEDLATDLFQWIITTNHAIALLQDATHLQTWRHTLHQIIYAPAIYERLRGGCTRLLFDQKYISTDTVSVLLSYALSLSASPALAAQWIEGFLYSSGLAFIYNQQLWLILNEWLETLPAQDFEQILPILRRAFAPFTDRERASILQLADTAVAYTPLNQETPMHDMMNQLPALRLLLGIGENLKRN